jgi:hypothetical protein
MVGLDGSSWVAGGGAVALSMEEQRILAEMERNLAAEDPRLASRLSSFGQQRLPGTLRTQRVRTVAGLLALAMIAAVTITMFMLSPYVNGRHGGFPKTQTTAGTSAPPRFSARHTNTGKAGSTTDAKASTGAGTARTGQIAPANATSMGKTSATGSGATRSGTAGSGSAKTGSAHARADKTLTSGRGSR